jgi:hypothetical protein
VRDLSSPGSAPEWPRIDDHIVQPETRQEIVRGERVEALPANAPHGDRHNELDYVIRGNVAEGYVPSSDLLTRVGPRSNFATDVCIRRRGTDPLTGTRYLEELAFEIVAEQTRRHVSIRAEELAARGVRRIFAIFVKHDEVAEWSRAERRFVPLPHDEAIEDHTLLQPILVQELLDAAAADDSVARALQAKRNPVLVRREQRVREEGHEEARRSDLLAMLDALNLVPTDEQRATITACHDADRLQRWLLGSLQAKSVSELLELG